MTDTPPSTTPPSAEPPEGNQPQAGASPAPSKVEVPPKTKVKLPKKPTNLNQFQNDPKFHQKSFNTNLKSTIRRAGPRGR